MISLQCYLANCRNTTASVKVRCIRRAWGDNTAAQWTADFRPQMPQKRVSREKRRVRWMKWEKGIGQSAHGKTNRSNSFYNSSDSRQKRDKRKLFWNFYGVHMSTAKSTQAMRREMGVFGYIVLLKRCRKESFEERTTNLLHLAPPKWQVNAESLDWC